MNHPVFIHFNVTEIQTCQNYTYKIDVYRHGSSLGIIENTTHSTTEYPDNICSIALVIPVADISFDDDKFKIVIRNITTGSILNTSNIFAIHIIQG